ncbi:transport protein, MMPL family [Lactobacillus plantarum WCFS1] [Lactiplantibacillus mudanjiangensis]|uniref:Transport protein, MMPL family [Lactobacillus plantarum WCFS1] n=1 Tax=Lactiplantibacillus mudanjiangensis TaxID=1296538 RepID=A0A660E9P3_9LACO|nr:transport protein, MMPL family [Lactobacillus plantarum WCFS1] [Lactiplantibacillus mudanjiangensis]VDG29185.1 transport protein, MMPL family [Lactobacillus plantarum WCFS1] [Lactiplantibacillus mudanjiangensis]
MIMVAAIFLLPNVSTLVRDKGQTQLPSSAKSQVAQVIQNHWGRNQNNTRQVVVVFSNGNSPLTAAQKEQIDGTIQRFKVQKSKYHVKSMTAASDNAAAKKQLISKDKSTELLQLMVGKNQTVENMTTNITEGAKTSGVKTYITGSDILNDDFTQETEAGIQKTEIITVIFIFIVLTLVFRSPITPLVSLLSVGVSFIISLSIVMNLVDKFNFPLSNFTQVFMVVVLFGIGTDYNILLFDQFKEELSHGDSPVAATGRALKIAGRTILYSGSSLLIGFSALGLANFSIYRSAVGVAVAVAILLLVLLTLNPFFMALLGPRLFWPSKKFAGGSTSKMWHGISMGSVRYPLIALLVVFGVSLPFILTYNSELNYDTLAELNDTIPAKQGFKVVQKHFSKGTAEPSTLYIKTDHALNNEKDLKVIDNLTKQLKKVKGVKTVASVTQPGGSEISALYLKSQLGTVTSGMKTAGSGLSKISSGLDSANSKLKSSNMSSGVSGAKKLATGSKSLQKGLVTYTNGVYTVNNGVKKLNSSTGTLASGVSKLSTGATKLNSGVVTYTNGVYTVNQGLNTLNSKTSTLASGVNKLATGTSTLFSGTQSLSSGLDTLNSKKSALTSGTATMTSSVAQLQSGSSQVTAGLQQMQSQLSAADTSQISTLKSKLQQLNTAMASLESLSSSSTSMPDISKVTTTANTLSSNSATVKSDAEKLQTALESISTSGSSSVSLSSSDVAAIVSAVNASGTKLNDAQTKALESALNSLSSKISSQVSSASSSAASGVASATSTAKQLQTDLATLSSTGDTLSSELSQLSSLSDQLTKLSSLGTLATNSIAANNASIQALDQLTSAVQQVQSALAGTASQTGLTNGSNQVTQGLTKLQAGAQTMTSSLNQYTNGVASAASGANKLTNGASTLNSGVSQLSSQVPTLTSAINALATGSNKLANNSSTLTSGTSQLASGLTTLNNKVPTLVSGIQTLAAGTNKLANSSATLNSGASQLATGNQTMYTTLQSLVKQMSTLQKGLASASTGTKKVNKGVKSANSYLTGVKNSDAAKTYYVPKSTLKGKTYASALKAYMSGNNHATKLTIVLNDNPSSKTAMNRISAIQTQATNTLKGTALDGATIAIGGQTSETNDTQSIASSDFIRTAAIMLVGILIALMFITRSVLQPFYILGTLLLAYIMSLSITRMLSNWFLGQSMLTWNTPFFGFIMLIALGVDYSIFLMMKYREFDNSAATPSTRIVRAAGVIGAVVLSAALILSGTFAALMPSGVLTLIQVAMVVIIGLVILVFAIPAIIPSLIRLTYPLTDRMENETTADKKTKRSRN